MSTDAAKPPPAQAQAHVSIELVLGVQQHNLWQRIAGAQSFWVTVALIVICLVMSYLQPESFASTANFFNITRNFSFIGIMALGMTAVIATGGIDLSVGSIMGLTAVASGLTLEAGYPAWAGDCGRSCGRGNHRARQRRHHRLRGLIAVCDDARHAVDCALLRGRAVRQPDALQFRPRRAGVQGARQRRRQILVRTCN